MPVTLAQAQINTQADVNYAVIDNLRRNSWLLDQVAFDDTVTPGTGGASLTYGYTRLTQARTASFRAINSEYTAAQAERQRYTVELKPLGGAFTVDRVLARLGASATNEITFQMQQLLTSVRVRFQDELINGDTAVDPTGFDGLDKSLTGAATEYLPVDEGVTAGYLDWTRGTIDTQAEAMAQLDIVDDWLSRIVPSTTGGGDLGEPGALPPGRKAVLGNTRSITRMRALARWAGIYTQERDDLGRQIERYGPWTLIDLGDNALGSAPIIPVETRDPDAGGGGGNVTNLTDLYACSFGLDALHGASVAGQPLVQTWMPDFQASGAVKSGEIEMGPVAAVLRNVKACGVLRNIKVA
ncbi:phage major capsid protein [Streptomyces sp. DSM 44917]|uniref:Phage major capsid protein n=1 Tax=Streptomyces boetiae TaxID=3075541 RepID=A0ABU2L3I0_9ACTN|nr:phage major capsid protein [Streptomyces sp. DSM 44917]MDT0306122.1 phage major capsid protein [Streptomyces sp. DSM 44917]